MEHKPSQPCWPCRNRHVQCDQSQIPCAKCVKSGLECSEKRPIRWVEGVAIRGKMQGRRYGGPSEKSSATVMKKMKKIVFKPPTMGPPTRPATVAPKHSGIILKSPTAKTLNVGYNGTYTRHWPMVPIATLQAYSILGLDHESQFYLHYYIEQVCNDMVLSQIDQTKLKDLVSSALHNSVLRKSLLALAARHLANRGQSFHQVGAAMSSGDAKANRNALIFKHDAMEALSGALRNPIELERDTTIASIFLFILLDLLESGSSGWNYHLEGAKSLLNLDQSQMGATAVVDKKPLRLDQDLRGFLMKKMYLIESLGSLFVRAERPTSLIPLIALCEQKLAQGSMEDSFLGCPEFLLRAIQFISTERDMIAAKWQHIQDGARHVHVGRIVAMLNLVESFDCYKSPFELRQEGSSQRDQQEPQHRRVLSQVYKIGTLIYGKRVLAVLTKEDTSLDEPVSELLRLLGMLRDNQDLLKCVLWPLFVAGLECRSPAQRQYFIMHLEKFWMATKCLNAINATKILQEYWRENKTDSPPWPFDSGRFGRVWLFM